MADRTKPSEAQYRKRKAEQAKEQAKQEGSFLKYFHTQKANEEQECDRTLLEAATGEAECCAPSTSHSEVSQIGNVSGTHTEEKEDVNISETSTAKSSKEDLIPAFDYNYSDPAKWPYSFNDDLRQLIIQHGPQQVVSHDFPKDSKNRRFSSIHYNRRLANGEEVCRQWLIYSTSKDVVFCFCCKLFSKRTFESSLQETGSKDWKNIGAILSSHERNTDHYENYQAWRELELRLSKDKTIDVINQQKIRQEEQYWQQVLQRLIALVRVLAMQNLAFRGTNDKLYSAGNGNFLKFVEYLALFDPIMNEHLRRVKDQETMVHYLGKDIQNELIQLLAGAIKQQIITCANAAKYYSIILDFTPDVSHIEQMTMIVRFVDVSKPSDDESESVTIKEHFLGFIPLQETTGAFIAETLLGQLEEIGLPIENLHSQGYDNGSNMKGKQNRAQKRILDLNPRAFFVPCNAHSLNLVVNDAARCCLEATTFFRLVQQIYNYFSTSTKRWHVLISHISDLGITVKPLSETRWESRIDALKPLRYHLGNIYDALVQIYDDTSLIGPSGNTSRIEPKGLADAISKFKFVVSLVTWYNILFEVNLTSKLLQNKEADLNSATRQLEVTKNHLISCRCDEGFQQV
uniref:TTF-type domain-containing protein n=1 Tax=Leptobrachium leishanense TaxID=445787 RepID=A0A8C5MKC1_9ANUR